MFFVFKAEAGKRNMGVPGVQTWALPICPSAILAEGWFANRHAKTAHGLIRYGKDEVVAVIDSTLAGRSVREVMPELERDAPVVGSLKEALERSEEHTSELQSRQYLVCRLLLEKKKHV